MRALHCAGQNFVVMSIISPVDVFDPGSVETVVQVMNEQMPEMHVWAAIPAKIQKRADRRFVRVHVFPP